MWRSGGARASSLAGGREALLGPVFKAAALPQAAPVILNLYHKLLAGLDPNVIPKDPKTELQEYLQKQSLPTPIYNVLEVTGEPHTQNFVIECRVSGLDTPVRGEGGTRRNAEQQAAAKALALLFRR